MFKPSTIICLMGPTASGKTALAIELVQRLPVSIISVDSAMVYRGMDIGTGKPSVEELSQAPHRLLDICDPTHPYSVGQFIQDAQTAVDEIQKEGKIPLFVGGTMLYFNVLRRGLARLPAANAQIREEIIAESSRLGWPALHERLATVDPLAAKKIHPNDKQRIQRALEVYRSTGKPMSDFYQAQQTFPYHCINLVISPKERAIIHERIAHRFDAMLEQGLVDEVSSLFSEIKGNSDLPSLRSVGYRQVWQYLQGQCDYANMRENAIAATRQLAKRQTTWLRQWENVAWFDSDSANLLEAAITYLTTKKD